MNSFTKGLLTGVFGVVVGLLISGSKNQDGQVGTYQISVTSPNKDDVFETILDTRTGKVISRGNIHYDSYVPVKIPHEFCCPDWDRIKFLKLYEN